MFSNRLPAHVESNTLTQRLAALRAAGASIVDLTESNPTRVELPYDADLASLFADPRVLRYDPHPFGTESAREAVAADHARRGAHVEPNQVILTASTSEAYTWLFKLLCNPGDAVLVPRPSYPLFEHLTRLEGVRAEPYDLVFHGQWEIDLASLAAAPPDVRALLLVTPNNPTGSFVSARELERLDAICTDRDWALVADEVFADFPLDQPEPLTDLAGRTRALSFSLGGCSKSLGLPQVKLGWIVVGGAPGCRRDALAALELIADSFLSVNTPVQVAAPHLLERAAPLRAAIHARVRENLRQLRRLAASAPACSVLPVGGGWSAVVRVPAMSGEEALVLRLLEDERVLVHPGYFFDFAHEAFIVISLLPPPHLFADAVTRVLRLASNER